MTEHFPFPYPSPSALAEIARTHIAYVRAVERLRCLCSELIVGLSTAAYPVIRRLSDSALVEVSLQIARERLFGQDSLLADVVDVIKKFGDAIAERNSLTHDEISPLGEGYGADFSVTAYKKSGPRDERYSEKEIWWDEPTLRQYREHLETITREIDALRHGKLDYGRVALTSRSRPGFMPDEIVYRTDKRNPKPLMRAKPLPKATRQAKGGGGQCRGAR